MSRGGARPGAGRKKGSLSITNAALLAQIEHRPGDLGDQLALVVDDATVDRSVRLEAARRLFGMVAGRIILGGGANG